MASLSAPVGLSFTHDGIGRLSEVDWDVAPGGSGTNSLAEYGWVGGLRQKRTVHYSVSASSKAESEFSYDAYNRLTKIEDEVWTSGSTHSQVSKFEYDYDVVHNLLKERYAKVGGSVGDRFAYDDYHRLSKAWMGVDSTVMGLDPGPGGWASGMHEHLTYGLDGVNNRTTDQRYTSATPQSQVYSLQSSTPQGPSNRYASVQPFGASTAVGYTYDNRGNLTFDGRFYYEYDFLNRLQTVKQLVVPDPEDDQEQFAVVDPQALEEAAREVNQAAPEALSRFPREHTDPTFRNRLKARVRGGVLRTRTSRSTRSGGAEYGMPAWRLIEDAELQLVAVYGYDHWNRRVVTAVATTAEAGTWFHAFDGWRQVGQYGLHYASGYYAVPVKEFVWGSRLDELLSYRRRVVESGTVSWETYYVLHGGQDTAAKLVSAAGVVVEQYEYDPYGRASVYVGASTTAAATSSVGLPFLWKAVRLDAETGLLYMRNRYYSTGLGRFLTRDPLGVWGSSLELGNECSYGGCGPLSWGDPLGLQAQPGPMKRFHPRSYAFDMSPSIEGRIESAIKVIESYLLRGAWGLCHYYVDLRVIWKYRWFRYNPGNPLPGGRGAENLPDETDGGVIGADGTRTRFDGRLNGIFIDPSIRLMDDYSLASLLVHEAVHLRQSIDGSELATYFAEVQAYAAQIAFLEMLLNKGGLGEAEEAVRRYLNGAVRSGYAAYTLAYIGTFCQIPGL